MARAIKKVRNNMKGVQVAAELTGTVGALVSFQFFVWGILLG